MDKINKYSAKKTKAGGKLVDATAAKEADLNNELDPINITYLWKAISFDLANTLNLIVFAVLV